MKLRVGLLPGAFGLALLGVASGCYSLQPAVGVEPQVGNRIAFDVNDAGRGALGGTMGQEISQVEGQLIEKQTGSYLLAVRSVRLLRGGEQVWSGEQVRLQSEYLGQSYQRRFSAGRTAALAAAGLGGVGAFILTRSFLVGGNEEPPPGCENPDNCNPNARLGRLDRRP